MPAAHTFHHHPSTSPTQTTARTPRLATSRGVNRTGPAGPTNKRFISAVAVDFVVVCCYQGKIGARVPILPWRLGCIRRTLGAAGKMTIPHPPC